jgi:glycosyltransferase involved in cell wall biosynthesis
VRVLYFGTYERDYPRNAQVIAALRRAGVEVDERNVPVWTARDNWRAGVREALRLAAAEVRLLRRPERPYHALIVGYPGQLDLPAARRAARGAPVVFNPLVSLADTLVDDRRRFAPGSPAARLVEWIDRRALRAADVVVADTRANADRLAEIAGLPPERVEVCLVGAEERLFSPPWQPQGPPLFVGKLIPLQGVETILSAAALQPELPLRVVGSGQHERLLRARPPNVEWLRWMPYAELPRAYRSAACALGIFGTGPKAARVIPNKVFQALACGTPVVTADTPAARELLVDGESALLVRPGDPAALSDAVRRLADDPRLAQRIGDGGLRAYREHASEEVLGHRWRRLLERTIS